MKLRKTLAAAGALAIAGGMLAVQPAGANTDPIDETTLTYSLGGGALYIDAPASALNDTAVVGDATANISVGATSVTNNAGLGSGWEVTSTLTNFVFDDVVAAGDDIPCSNFTWLTTSPGGPTGVDLGVALDLPAGAVVFADGDSNGTCDGALPVIAGVNLLSGGTYTYTGTGTLAIPATALAGNYVATLTQTVSAASVL